MRNRVKNFKKISLLLILSLLINADPPLSALAASTQKIYSYTSKATVYVDSTQITYIYNGKKIDLTGTPGILTSNNVAMAPHSLIFRDTLGMTTKYDSATKTVTFKKDGTTLVLTMGSKTAVLNGKKVTMSAAPMSMKYAASGKTAILVPTRFVAESFGYSYNWNSSTATVTITKPLSLSYDGKQLSYTSTIGKVSLDGTNINVTNLPTIIMANTAMVQAYRVFKIGLGAEYKYNFMDGTVTLKKGDIALVLELNSSIAYLNGKPVDCGVAPKLVTNNETGSEVIMVPAQFVSKALGYDYTWNETTKTSEIKTTDLVGITPNLIISSGSSAESYSPITLFSWSQLSEMTSQVENAIKASQQEKSINYINGDFSFLNTIFDPIMEQGCETFTFSFSSPFSLVTATEEGDKVMLSFDKMFANETIASFNNDLVQRYEVSLDNDNSQTDVIFSMKSEYSNYELIPSEDYCSLSIKFYPNYLTKVETIRDEKGYQYVTITGQSKLTPQITEDSNSIYVYIPGTVNAIGDQTYTAVEESEKGLIPFVTINSQTSNSQVLVIQKPEADAIYNVHEDGNTFSIYIGKNEEVPTINNNAIEVKLPDGVTASDITDEDKYYNKQFELRISGDYRGHFVQNPIINTYESVANIKVTYNSYSNQTVITVSTNSIQGYKYQVKNNTLYLTVAQPSAIYDKIVILDAGHGGKDPGAIKGSAQEKVINFNVLNVYAKEYFNNSDIKIYYTRVDDTLIALKDRADFALQVEADMFISLHCNASSSSAARGTSVYYSSTNKSKSGSGLTSKILASSLVNKLSASLGTKNLGIIDKGFVVVRDNSVPAVLIELAFLTNPEDKANLVSASFQKKAAKTIFDTVTEVLKAYPTNR